MPTGTQADKGQSIMFGDPDPVSIQPRTDTVVQEQTNLCQQLRREMDEL